MKTIFIIFYFALLAFIAFYGIHLYWLISIYLKNRKSKITPPEGKLGTTLFPKVTIQLPIYNEKRVAIRLIEAVKKFEWDKEKLEIQVLDDSNDITSELVSQYIESQESNLPVIKHIKRSNRDGFKAGALANGLKQTDSEFITIFDADNIPRSDFLKRLIPHFNDKSIGMVQARWSFLNRDESFLCRAQSLFLDAHFRIEQQARYQGNLLFNFNGTAGVWRRNAIDDAGGWEHDTLTEDFDLSIRAQLAGWKFIYRDDYGVPTELPNAITSFKTQQYRWAKGAIETGVKLYPKILKSRLPFKTKLASGFHFSHKAVSLALMLLALLLVPALYIRMESGVTKLFFIDLPIFLAGTGSMTLFYTLANRKSNYQKSWRDYLTMPILTSLGVALATTNSKALLSALFNRKTSFVRTPKSGSTDTKNKKIPISYHYRPDSTIIFEIFLSIYSILAFIIAFDMGLYISLPFLLTFVIGYSYFATHGIRDYVR